jgi:Tol biopolymer transport system component
MLLKPIPKRIVTGAVLLAMVAVGGPCLAEPAQQEIAFVSWRGGAIEIYRMHGNGEGQTNLTRDGSMNSSPRWSPDGSQIVYLTQLRGELEIYSMRADGEEQTNLTRSEAREDYPRWSPDGTKIAFIRKTAEDNYDIWTMDPDGDNQEQLTRAEGNDWYPAWSPDGQWIVFQSFRSGSPQLWKMRRNGDMPTQLTNDENGAGDAQWSPDGRWIVYASARTGDLEIWKMLANGTQHALLTNAEGIDRDPHWSPNGEYIVFRSERDGNSEIYCMDHDGDGQTNLTRNPGSDNNPTWSDDGAHILFFTDRDGNAEVYTMAFDGSEPLRLTHSDGMDFEPMFGPRIEAPPVGPGPAPVVGPGTICFQRTTQSENVSEIRLMEPDGSNMRACQRRDAPLVVEDPAFDADASRIAYVVHDFTRRRAVDSALLWCPRGCGTENLVIRMQDALFDDPMWHPEGDRILFRYRPAGEADYRAATYAWTRLDVPGLTPLAIDGYDVSLSPDGQSLAVVRVPNIQEYRAHIWVTDQWGNNPRQLTMTGTDEPVVDHGPSWSPDGTTIAFFRSRDPHLSEDLCLVPATGGQPSSVWTADLPELKPVRDTHLVWSPDGRELLFASGHEDSYSLYILTLGPPVHRLRRLTDAAGLDWQSDWR